MTYHHPDSGRSSPLNQGHPAEHHDTASSSSRPGGPRPLPLLVAPFEVPEKLLDHVVLGDERDEACQVYTFSHSAIEACQVDTFSHSAIGSIENVQMYKHGTLSPFGTFGRNIFSTTVDDGLLFHDSFESADTDRWAAAVP